MDYSQEQYLRMQQSMGQKMPFYMTYPMQSIYITEMEYEQDMDQMKELYPKEVKKIQVYVDEACDQMEYDGSLMFDESPDRIMLRRVCERIYDKAMKIETPKVETLKVVEAEEMFHMGGPIPGGPRPGEPHPSKPPRPPMPPQNDGMRDLIEVLLYNEMFKRRCRHRRCRRWW